ncbi:MAG TPA: isoprenylcysteine carboxylmethyltransferase family protein [Tepidisphaeraceae bacterium]|nr:isoprenylcysteine carboxylmethyltransferase family protein [Tepidisphaeraceae bacterium]
MHIDSPASVAAGAIMALYWFKVMQLVDRARRWTGKAGGLVPREPIGRATRLIWTPVIAIWIIVPLITGLHRPSSPVLRPLYASGGWGWFGVAVMAACFAATAACWKRMGKSWRMGIDPDEKTTLIATGPYAIVRHPIYALSQVMMLATMAIVPSILMLAAGIVHIGLLQWEARREERYLLAVHGTAYADYCRRVGGFLPRRSVSRCQPQPARR